MSLAGCGCYNLLKIHLDNFWKNKNMTLPESTDKAAGNSTKKPMNIGSAVKQLLLEASEEGRVVHGVYACAKLLEIEADSVMLCVLPEADPAQDVAVHIQHKLIEAYCLEHQVKVLKVDSSEKLEKLISLQNSENNNNEGAVPGTPVDFSCVLVQHPKMNSSSDNFALDFCEVEVDEVFPRARIELPV